MSFVHLHVHSEYSLLDGFSNLKKLVKRVQEMGMPAVALTDHGTMFGVVEFYKAAKDAGVKPIIGLEAYLSARTMTDRDSKLDKQSSHLLLLAENEVGYRNLLAIASEAQLKGFYYFPRIDRDFLAAHAEGIIATSGCMAAEIPRTILREGPEAARKKMDWYYDVFGQDRFFIELQQHDIKELPALNKTLMDLGVRYQARYVATNDVHYINPSDARLQDILLAIQTGSVLSDPNRFRMTDQSYYLRSPGEMASLFSEVPEALSNTVLIADRCNVNLDPKGYHLPLFPVPEGHTAQTYLRQLCDEGLRRRYGPRANDPKVLERLEYELKVIHEMGFDAYFLIVWDLCRHARQTGVWYNARGSAAGSMVAYTLDITLVEPIGHGLIFERFLNPGRISMPDIDLDFQDDLRPRMLEYTAQKYGDDKVAQIITFGTLGARAALRDVARVMDIPIPEVDRVAKLIPNIPGKPVSIAEALEEVPELKQIYNESDVMRNLIDTAGHMEGVVRNAGTHAAGVVIADKPVVEYLPLHRPTSGSEESPIKTVTQFEMSILENQGMLKVDFLGLATLTIMSRACQLIKERHGLDLNLNNIPIDDPETFKFIGEGHTAGVFQLEGNGMTRYIAQMKPQNLANVIAMVALYRPGPLEFIPTYIKRMHGEEKVTYRHQALEPIFNETYGIPIYQEQIMFAAMDIGGYTASEADDLRKAISKKKADAIAKHRLRFIDGAQKGGMPEQTAQQIFEDWENFARYGFNKCLPGDVEVIDAVTGRLHRVEDLYSGAARIEQTVTCDVDSLRLQAGGVSKVMDNGIKPVFELTTQSGRSIEATANHPFYTPEGWRLLEELKPGDRIAIPRRLPVCGTTEWPEHEVIALGHLLAEGNLCHPHSVYFYGQDRAMVDDFVRAAEAFENVSCTVRTHKSTFSVYAGRIDRKSPPGIFRWAKDLGMLGKTAREKEIPAEAFELTNRQVALLLSRMWQGDGHVDAPGRSLFYATASKRLAHQVQHLLLRLGIHGRIRQVRFPYRGGRTGYQVFVTGNDNLAEFSRQIGCHYLHSEDRDRLDALVLAEPARSTKDVVPLRVKELVRAAKERSGLSWKEIHEMAGVAQREFYPVNTAGKSGFNHRTIGRLAIFFDDPALRRWADNDIYWDEVTAIEPAGEKRTYDLEVPGTHNFVANDILVHNSHAADYGVIAVQTGYLKAHYTVEYMTALLSASKNEAEKVALYVADCRAMGIIVLPPDVNVSGWDFTIEDREEGAAIRFGMGAVKNVGQAPVDLILEARKGGPFAGLTDFTHRVDLRQLGKRALECLVKVGALDRLGNRSALLEALDRIIAVSTSHFKAIQSSQLSFFGSVEGMDEEIRLPAGGTIDPRDLLNWERELIGLYISDNPLSPYIPGFRARVTHQSTGLAEVGPKDKIIVGGIITRVRTHQTKDGKMMGFATMEDLQGAIELVVFPRTWEQCSDLLQVDKVVLVEGKVDNERGDPKVLVDRLVPAPVIAGPKEEPGQASEAAVERPAAAVVRKPAQTAAPSRVAEAEADFEPAAFGEEDVPPPEFDDWDASYSAPVPAPAAPAAERAVAAPVVTPARPAEVRPVPQPVSAVEAEAPAKARLPEKEVHAGMVAEEVSMPEQDPGMALPPFIVSPTPVQAPGVGSSLSGDSPRMLTIVLRASGDRDKDVRRMRCIHGALRSCPGRDKFAFHILEGGRRYLLEFPNESTGICGELLGKLTKFVEEENVRIDPLIIQ